MKILFLKIETPALLSILLVWTLMALLSACGGGKNDRPSNMENMEGMKDNNLAPFDSALNLSTYVLPSNSQVISAQKTVMAMPASNVNVIKALGYIVPDERLNNKVAVRFSGRIEKLYIRYNLQYVKKGEKILDLYSPDLNTDQEELLFLLKDNSEPALAEKARASERGIRG